MSDALSPGSRAIAKFDPFQAAAAPTWWRQRRQHGSLRMLLMWLASLQPAIPRRSVRLPRHCWWLSGPAAAAAAHRFLCDCHGAAGRPWMDLAHLWAHRGAQSSRARATSVPPPPPPASCLHTFIRAPAARSLPCHPRAFVTGRVGAVLHSRPGHVRSAAAGGSCSRCLCCRRQHMCLPITHSARGPLAASPSAGDLAQVQNEEQAGDLGSQLNGALASTFMGPVLTASR